MILPQVHSFDLVRITRTKQEIGIATSTVRQYVDQGLRLYKCGKAAFVSKAELEAWIKTQSRIADGSMVLIETVPPGDQVPIHEPSTMKYV